MARGIEGRMNAREQIRTIPLETLVEMVRILTDTRADPQFVRAIAMDMKRKLEKQNPELRKSDDGA